MKCFAEGGPPWVAGFSGSYEPTKSSSFFMRLFSNMPCTGRVQSVAAGNLRTGCSTHHEVGRQCLRCGGRHLAHAGLGHDETTVDLGKVQVVRRLGMQQDLDQKALRHHELRDEVNIVIALGPVPIAGVPGLEFCEKLAQTTTIRQYAAPNGWGGQQCCIRGSRCYRTWSSVREAACPP